MRLAILTDIHANRAAFEAVLADVDLRRVDRIVILGDIVGYGPDPEWCCDKVQALQAAGAIVVQGNHDAAITTPDPGMNVTALRLINWTRPRLSDDQKSWLAKLPLTERLGDLLFVHASANTPGDWIYVNSAQRAMGSFRVVQDRVIFCGHVHVPALYSCDVSGRVTAQRFTRGAGLPLIRSRRWMTVVGSVGQPRDGRPLAAWALYDTTTNELTFHGQPYDVKATLSRIEAENLPHSLALRLMSGV